MSSAKKRLGRNTAAAFDQNRSSDSAPVFKYSGEESGRLCKILCELVKKVVVRL